jgi:hypothetical protein
LTTKDDFELLSDASFAQVLIPVEFAAEMIRFAGQDEFALVQCVVTHAESKSNFH